LTSCQCLAAPERTPASGLDGEGHGWIASRSRRAHACNEKNAANEDAICSWSVKELDCPAKGCPALQIAFEDYTPDDAPDHHRPPTADFSEPDIKKDWEVALNPVGADLSGKQCNYTKVPVVCAP